MGDMNVKGMLTKKLGPLPAWGWGLVLGGGYLGYRMLSGKGASLTGSTSANEVVADEYADEYGSADAAYGTGGGVPNITINMPDSAVSSGDISDELAASKAYAQKMKTRGDNWANWGRRWKDQAKGTPGLRAPLKRGTNKPKTSNTAKSKRRGTQGTQKLQKTRTAAPQRTQREQLAINRRRKRQAVK